MVWLLLGLVDDDHIIGNIMTYWILGIMYYIISFYIMFILWFVWWLLGIFTYASSSSWRLIGNCEECLSSTPSVEACTYLELSLTYVPPPVHDFSLIDYVILLLSFSYWVIYYYWTFEHSPQSTILTQPHVNTVLESPHTNIGFGS